MVLAGLNKPKSIIRSGSFEDIQEADSPFKLRSTTKEASVPEHVRRHSNNIGVCKDDDKLTFAEKMKQFQSQRVLITKSSKQAS